MNKRSILAIVLALTFLTLSGCSDKQDKSKEKSVETNTVQEESKGEDKVDSSSNTTSKDESKDSLNKVSEDKKDSNKSTDESSKNKKDSFYGKWKINKLCAHGKVSANSQEDIDKQIGKVIELSESKVIYDGKTFSNPKYVERILSSSEFEQQFKVSLSHLNITADSIKEVSIDGFDTTDNYSEIGTAYLIKDDNTIILEFNGDYLELSRIN